MKTLVRALLLLCPMATVFSIVGYWSPFRRNALETITFAGSCYFIGFLLHAFSKWKFRFQLLPAAFFSLIILGGVIPVLRKVGIDGSAALPIAGGALLVQGFLFQWALLPLTPLFILCLVLPALVLVVLPLSLLTPLKLSNEFVLTEKIEFEDRFRFTEEARMGGLPIHRLYRNEQEKFNGETEQTHYLCLVTLPLQLDRILRGGQKRLLVIGGADGLAARSALSFSSVKQITVLDSNLALFETARSDGKFRIYNLDSLNNSKTKFISRDPFNYLIKEREEQFDTIVVEQVDSRYLSLEFFALLSIHLSENGTIVIDLPESELGVISLVNKLWGYSGLAVRAKNSSKQIAIFSKGSTSIEQAVDTLINGPQRLPCQRIPLNALKGTRVRTLSTAY